jgi:hypothetical protein
MLFLNPLYWLARSRKNISALNQEQKLLFIRDTHKIPNALLNNGLAAVFSAESPIGHLLRLPFWASILGVFRKI